MKRLIFIFLFPFLLPLNLGISLVVLQKVSQVNQLPELVGNQIEELSQKKFPAQVYAALPATVGEIYDSVKSGDARPVILGKYLKRYHSPMKPYDEIAQTIVEISDQEGLDWRLLVAIAQQESNLGKKMPREDCHNAWGYGIHSRGTLCFETWEQGIEAVAKGIRKKYLDQGLDTPEKIMAKYTPLSSGSWANGVNQFLEDLRLGGVK